MSIKSRSTAGTPRFPGSALVEHWAMEGCSRGQPKKLKTWEKEQKEDRRKGAEKSLFLTPFARSFTLFCFKSVMEGTILPHFVEPYWKCLVINKILSSSSPLRWVTKTYWGGGGGAAFPPPPPPPILYPAPSACAGSLLLLPHTKSDKREPRESVSLCLFCLFFRGQKRLEWSDDGLTSKKWGTERKERVKKKTGQKTFSML